MDRWTDGLIGKRLRWTLSNYRSELICFFPPVIKHLGTYPEESVEIVLLEWKGKATEGSICPLDNRHSKVSWLFFPPYCLKSLLMSFHALRSKWPFLEPPTPNKGIGGLVWFCPWKHRISPLKQWLLSVSDLPLLGKGQISDFNILVLRQWSYWSRDNRHSPIAYWTNKTCLTWAQRT